MSESENGKAGAEYMAIREMCDRFGVTPRALRFYESKELLAPVREGQKRLFSRRDRARLALILRAKRFGFSLEEIRQVLDLYERPNGRALQLSRFAELGAQRLRAMVTERAELDSAIHDLEKELKAAETSLADMQPAQKAC